MSPTPIRHPDTDLRDYRPELDDPGPRWVAWVLLIALMVLVFTLGFGSGRAYGAALDAPRQVEVVQQPFRSDVEAELPCLELHVRPRIMLPLSRQDIRIEARVRRHAHHRQLSIAWDGGFAGGGGSAQQLRGADEAVLIVRTLKNHPAAPWFFVAAVFDQRGRLTGRQTASILMPESGQ